MSSNAYVVHLVDRYVEDLLTHKGDGLIDSVTVFGSEFVIPRERRFSSVGDIQDYVDELRSGRWVWATWPDASSVPVRVIEKASRGGTAGATMTDGVLSIHPTRKWMREITVLHELAHHYSEDGGHGDRFREAYLTLVDEVMSPQLAYLMRIGYRTEGTFGEPTKGSPTSPVD